MANAYCHIHALPGHVISGHTFKEKGILKIPLSQEGINEMKATADFIGMPDKTNMLILAGIVMAKEVEDFVIAIIDDGDGIPDCITKEEYFVSLEEMKKSMDTAINILDRFKIGD